MRTSAFKIPPPREPDIRPQSRFAEARHKLHWARIRAHETSLIWEDFVTQYNSDPARFEKQLASGLPAQFPIPVGVPLSIGDCLHNLRNSIDYLVSKLARDASLDDKQTIFPFAAERNGIKSSFAASQEGQQGKKGRRAGALYDLNGKYGELEGLVLDVVRPYSIEDGGTDFGDLIWRINHANNIDKHRLLMPSINRAQVKEIVLQSGGVPRFTFRDVEIEGHPFQSGSILEVQGEADFSADVLFAEPTRLSGRPVMNTLVQACDAGAKVISIFEQTFDT